MAEVEIQQADPYVRPDGKLSFSLVLGLDSPRPTEEQILEWLKAFRPGTYRMVKERFYPDAS